MITKVSIKTGALGASFSLLFFTGTAKSQGVIYAQPSQPIYYAAGVLDNTVDIDVNGDGIPDFAIISTSSYTADIAPLGNNSIIAVPAPPRILGISWKTSRHGRKLVPQRQSRQISGTTTRPINSAARSLVPKPGW